MLGVLSAALSSTESHLIAQIYADLCTMLYRSRRKQWAEHPAKVGRMQGYV